MFSRIIITLALSFCLSGCENFLVNDFLGDLNRPRVTPYYSDANYVEPEFD